MFADFTVESLCAALAAALDAEMALPTAPRSYSSLWTVHGLDISDHHTGFGVHLAAEFDTHPTEALLGLRFDDPEVLGLVLSSEATLTLEGDRSDIRMLYVLLRDGTETALIHRHTGHTGPEIITSDPGRSGFIAGRVAATARRIFSLPSNVTLFTPLPTPAQVAHRRGLALVLMLQEISEPEDLETLLESLEVFNTLPSNLDWDQEHAATIAALRLELAELHQATRSSTPAAMSKREEMLARRIAELEWVDAELFALFSDENTPSLEEISSEIARRTDDGTLPTALATKLVSIIQSHP